MWYVFLFYWIVCGFCVFDKNKDFRKPDGLDLFIYFSLGGFIVPAVFLRKLLR